MFRQAAETSRLVACAPRKNSRNFAREFADTKKMPDINVGVVVRHLVDVQQQRLNCALPSFSLSSGFFRFQSLKRHVHLDDQLIHPKGLAVDLVLPRPFFDSRFNASRITALPRLLLRKEVIQPQVPLRLPCYDFIPVTAHSVEGCLPCGLARRLRLQATSMM